MASLTHADAVEHDEHAHPSQATYVKIAAMLAIITAIEVAIYYIPFVHDSGLLVPILVGLSLVKFVVVVAYFMHLKFDAKLLAFAFGFSMLISVIMFIALWVIMHFDSVDMSQVVPDKSL